MTLFRPFALLILHSTSLGPTLPCQPGVAAPSGPPRPRELDTAAPELLWASSLQQFGSLDSNYRTRALQQTSCLENFILFFKIFICLFGCSRSWLRHVGPSLQHAGFSLVMAHGL